MKIIGEIIIHEKGYSPTSVNIFEGVEIEIKRSAKDKSMVVYRGGAERFLKGIHWYYQYINETKVNEEYKTWRK